MWDRQHGHLEELCLDGDSQGLCSSKLGATSEGRRRDGLVGPGRPCGEVCSLAAGNTNGLFFSYFVKT